MSALYKYLPPERQTFLTDGMLRFSQPSALNDPFECFPALPQAVLEEAMSYLRQNVLESPAQPLGTSREERRKINRDYLKRSRHKIAELPTPDQFRKKFLENAQANMDAKLGILSLSRRWNSALMWAHYTSSHTGFCVGFNRNHNFFRRPDSGVSGEFFCAPVRYSPNRPSIEFRPLITSDAHAFLLTKSSDWTYEEEERVVTPLSLADSTIDAAPFPVALFKIPSDAVNEITVGIRAPEDLVKKASAFCATHKIPLYRAVISASAYDFERKRIKI